MTDMSAQSDAPSAEEWFDQQLNAISSTGLYFKAEVRTVAEAYAALRTARQDGRIAHLQEDFECEIGAKNRAFKRAETAEAKVAQLERELAEVKQWNERLAKWIDMSGDKVEAAESALSEARELLALYRAKREVDGGPGRVWDSGKHLIAEEAIAKIEAGASGAAGKGGADAGI